MASLLVKIKDREDQHFPIKGKRVSIGRSLKNDIVLSDNTASREHAEILYSDGQYYIRDLNSTHGTFVGDRQVTDMQLLRESDSIHIGSTTIRLCQTEPVLPKTALRDEEDSTPISKSSQSTITYSVRGDSGLFYNAGRAQHSAVLADLANAMKAVFDVDELLPTLMDTVFHIFQPDRGAIMLLDEQSGEMTCRCERPEAENIQISHTVINQTINERMSVLISDIKTDERFNAADSIMAQSIISAICCPLLGKDRILGLIYIDSLLHKMHYTKDDLALLNIIAANASVAIENAQLLQQKVQAERLAAFGVAIAGISHFAKNVIAGMQGSMDIMDRALQKKDFDIACKAWPILRRSNLKIRTLVQEMLSYAKPREPQWQDGNLAKMLREIYESQKDRAEKDGVKLLIEIPENFPDSQFDKNMIHDALLNLTTNAIEACKDMEEVTVKLRAIHENGHIIVDIADTGPGIPEDILPRLFEPFFSTKGSQGTGLGLAVTKKAIEEHGGTIGIDTAMGKGATFSVQLPLGPAATDAL